MTALYKWVNHFLTTELQFRGNGQHFLACKILALWFRQKERVAFARRKRKQFNLGGTDKHFSSFRQLWTQRFWQRLHWPQTISSKPDWLRNWSVCSSQCCTLFHSANVAWILFNFSNSMEDTFFTLCAKHFTGKSCSVGPFNWPGR